MRRLILKSTQSPGDILMLTAAIRDLHAAHPGQFETDVRTPCDALWENNPHLTRLCEGESGVEGLEMHYPLIHQSNQRPYHFLHGYAQYLEKKLGVRIPLTRFQGDIHLSHGERREPPLALDLPPRYWIIVAGGKFDFTAKWWNPASYQAVVDHFEGSLAFVQCGEAAHWHPPLRNAINLVGRTTLREFVRLMHHADGVICPVTFAMHLAAAVETKPGRPRSRACVVIAGGREPTHWEAYPAHRFLSTVGALECCETGGCWKSRCQQVGDGDPKDDKDLCERPITITPDLRIPQCLDMITPEDVIRQVESYLNHKLRAPTDGERGTLEPAIGVPRPLHSLNLCPTTTAMPKKNLLIEFRHGLGDAIQLTIVLKHLAKHRPDWNVDVAALRGKHSAFVGLCRNVYVLDDDGIDRAHYQELHNLQWHDTKRCSPQWPNTKPSRCLQEVFSISPDAELFRYEIQIGDTARERARLYLERVTGGPANDVGRFRTVLLHYEGNTSGPRKNLPHDVAQRVCETVLRLGFVPIVLDWDGRSPLPDGVSIHNPGAEHELWNGLGTGDAQVLAALIESSTLLVGIDSGPLHVAGATTTPALGVWTQHHPAHYFDVASNVLHLVPTDHDKLAAGTDVLDSFRRHYRWITYSELAIELTEIVASVLQGAKLDELAARRSAKPLTATGYTKQYYQEHKTAGLDYLNFGQWHEEYGRWFVDSLRLKGLRVLDVGCACGAMLRGLGQAGAVVQGVEINEHMVQLGREKWPDMSPLLHVCDAANLHCFRNESWDAIHTAQVAEHWKPELVPVILRELARITVAGGLLFASLDTEELFARQRRSLENEDPTHVCIRPMNWWHDILHRTGWQICSAEFENSMREHDLSFLRRYDWDWFVARKIEVVPGIAHQGVPARLPACHETLWEKLLSRMHPLDLPPPADWQRHYQAKFAVAAELKANRICEIGVRAGYSAFAFFEARPNAFLLGIDSDGNEHGGVKGFVQHARGILAERDFALMLYDSQRLATLPGEFDLVHVDGDHTYQGTLHDLQLAWAAGRAVLVDDYASIADVGRATDDFFAPQRVELHRPDDKQLLAIKQA